MKRKLRQEDEEEAQDTKMEIHKVMWRAHFAETREENAGDREKDIAGNTARKKLLKGGYPC